MKGDLTLINAHEIADQAKKKLQRAFPNIDIITHEDPVRVKTDIKSF